VGADSQLKAIRHASATSTNAGPAPRLRRHGREDAMHERRSLGAPQEGRAPPLRHLASLSPTKARKRADGRRTRLTRRFLSSPAGRKVSRRVQGKATSSPRTISRPQLLDARGGRAQLTARHKRPGPRGSIGRLCHASLCSRQYKGPGRKGGKPGKPSERRSYADVTPRTPAARDAGRSPDPAAARWSVRSRIGLEATVER